MLNIQKLKKLQKIIKISSICEIAGINSNTIRTKINNQTELTIKESELLTKVIKDFISDLS